MRRFIWGLLGLLMVQVSVANAQFDRAAVLEILAETVEVQRVGTVNRIPVRVEAIVGVGDTIYVGDSGRARINYFGADVTTILQANTTYRIDAFAGEPEAYTLALTVLGGQTTQIVQPLLRPDSSYTLDTPGFTLSTRLARFAIRVEQDAMPQDEIYNGRSSVLVFDGEVRVDGNGQTQRIAAGFGLRGPVDGPLSDVVRADTFPELDSALDGCLIDVSTPDDTIFNVRRGPSFSQPIIGYVAPDAVERVFGATQLGRWYRLRLNDGIMGWFLASSARIVGDCPRLRDYANTYVEPEG